MTTVLLEALKGSNLNNSETKEHLNRVKVLTKKLIEIHNNRLRLNLDNDYVNLIIKSSSLHDLGKVSVPDNILYKKGILDDNERIIIETHPITGIYILKKLIYKEKIPFTEKEMQVVGNVILYHHERWNGTGYPYGLKGNNIPFEARLLTLVDVYDAITSQRCYKEAWTIHEAFRFIESKKGEYFDPEIVESFMQMKKWLTK